MSVFREAIYGVRFDDERKEGAIERREEIVRCRDCTSFVVDGNQVAKCTTPCGDSLHGTASCDPDGFCAWGTRRDE